MRSILGFGLLIVFAGALAFLAVVAIYQRDAPGDTFMARAMNVVSEMTSTKDAAKTADEVNAAAPAVRAPATTLTPEALAALTSAIRAELRAEAQENEKSQFWSDVGVSAIFMLLGAMFGELRTLLGLGRR